MQSGSVASVEAKVGALAIAVDMLAANAWSRAKQRNTETNAWMSGLVVAWSKCHGHLPMALLREVAQQGRIPATLAACALPRFARLGGMAAALRCRSALYRQDVLPPHIG